MQWHICISTIRHDPLKIRSRDLERAALVAWSDLVVLAVLFTQSTNIICFLTMELSIVVKSHYSPMEECLLTNCVPYKHLIYGPDFFFTMGVIIRLS